MKKIILGKKIKMTRFFDKNGNDYPATLINAGPCFVTQLKNMESNGYNAVQVGFESAKNTNKPIMGKFEKLKLNGNNKIDNKYITNNLIFIFPTFIFFFKSIFIFIWIIGFICSS